MTKENMMRSETCKIRLRRALSLLPAVLLSCALATVPQAQSQSNQNAPAASQPAPKAFDTPQQAAQALIQATDSFDVPALIAILGPGSEDLVSSPDPVQDKKNAAVFAAKAHEKNAVNVDPKNSTRAILSVGNDDWPFPVPIVKKGGKWHFDSKEGHDEILFRRIGSNELDAIQICLGYVEAQKEYASEIHDDSGVNQYAQKIISTPGKKDGLCWKNPDGTLAGPISEGIAHAMEEGYSRAKGLAYHGYYFKILKGQGPAAPLGQLDYVIKGIMIGGFALVAVPAEYRVTGVKTFMVSNDGIVYEKDLGPDTLNVAKAMERYNPDKTWHRTDDEWPPTVSAAKE
jgi:hypothetical protein